MAVLDTSMMAKKKSEAQETVLESKDPVQPELNIGLVGHVDHGKTTLTEQLTGKWTDTHSQEIKRGITIRLGYADSVFRKCTKCEGSEAFMTKPECPTHKIPTEFLRKVSFVDAPGHESLMATMLSGATIMDGAMLLVAANETCPQPQTREHLMALEICGIKNIVIVQNKIDLVASERALRNYQQIKEFLKGSAYENAPIIPVSAQHSVNIGALIQAIEEFIPTPKRNDKEAPLMFLARSFDVNKPGMAPRDMKGGVLGGALVKGKLKVGDKIEIRPGHVVEEQNRKVSKPLFATILSIMTGSAAVEEAKPGGSIGVMTTLDPSIVMSDSLVGNVVGLPGKLPTVLYELELETSLLERVVGSEEELKVDPIKMNEPFMLNVNAAATVGFVTDISKNKFKCKLKLPICADPGARVTISRRVGTRFRLIGYGIILDSKK
ncbi:MAG: translation initiation factor IF-2 subunit gamma [Nanoarchaeota archaeon]